MDAVAITVITGIGVLVALLFRFLRTRSKYRQVEPVIELERLVNCTSCGSLVPEGVNRCAFCGATQEKPS